MRKAPREDFGAVEDWTCSAYALASLKAARAATLMQSGDHNRAAALRRAAELLRERANYWSTAC